MLTSHFPERLQESAYGNDEDIKTMLDQFDKSTKPVFKDEKENSYIKFGAMGCNDPKVKIRRGQLQLAGCVGAAHARMGGVIQVDTHSDRDATSGRRCCPSSNPPSKRLLRSSRSNAKQQIGRSRYVRSRYMNVALI